MQSTANSGETRLQVLGVLAAVVPAAVVAMVLWFVTVPLLTQAGATSLAVATLVAGTSAGQSLFHRRDSWRYSLVSALVQFIILWPLVWLLTSYNARHP